MTVTCPKCEYTRTARDTAPAYECPRCGIIYAKAKPRLPAQRAGIDTHAPDTRSPSTRPPDTRPLDLETPPVKATFRETIASTISALDKRQKQIGIAIIFASFVLGYFVGREHIKYEIRSAFQDTAAGLKNLFGGAGNKTEAEKPKAAKQSQASPIQPKLLRKGTREGEYGRSSISFALAFANTTGKSIRAFDGTLTFTDLLGNEIHGAKLAVNDPIAAGGTLEWEGKLDYNQFISSHEHLRNSDLENTKVVFSLKRILFEDGEVKEY